MIPMIEVIKVGKTYIKDENITFSDFKEKYNLPNYKLEWEIDGDDMGHTLTDGNGKVWWVGEEFFKNNYKKVL